MNKIIPLLIVFCLLVWAQNNNAQNIVEKSVEVQVTHAKKMGTTIPIRDKKKLTKLPLRKSKMIQAQQKANQKAKQKQNGQSSIPPNFMNNEPYVSPNPNALPIGEDKVRQKGSLKNMGFDVEPLVNIRAQTSSFGSPHDPSGDIGKEFYFQGINATDLAVYDKEGNLIDSFSANDIWADFGYNSGGDPIILYDQEFDRWLLTEFPDFFSSNPNTLLVAISEDNDPLGSWDVYEFGTPEFPDYPKYSVWNNAYAVTTNEEGSASSPAYFIDRAALLNGDDVVEIQRLQIPSITTGPGLQVDSPVDWTGSNPPPADQGPMLVSMVDDGWGASEDRIDVHQINIDWSDEDNTSITTIEIPTTPFDSDPCSVGPGIAAPCIPQLGGSGIDGIPTVIYNQVHYRNFTSHESIVLCFAVDAGGDIAGIRWMELRRLPNEDWTLYQEGTIAPDDGLHRVLGCIAIDFNGNIGLAYNVSGEENYPGTRFTGRRASDPLGEMTVNEYVIVEGTNAIGSVRFGDYSQMSVDPVDERTFWFTAEYGGGEDEGFGFSTTRIAAFALNRDTTDIGPFTIVSPQNSAELEDSEVVQIQVKNYGVETQNNFQVGYSFEGGEPIIEDVVYELPTDSVYTHTFTPTVDMSIVGGYNLSIFTVLEGDQGEFNNVYERTISKLPRIDAGVSQFVGLDETGCSETVEIEIGLTNYGVSDLTSAEIEVQLNGEIVEVVEWTGTLLNGETEFIPVTINGLINGANTMYATTNNPNEMEDEIPANDSFTRNFNAIVGGVSVVLELQTDNFPSETTWEIESDDGTIFIDGGPYSTANSPFTEAWCLDKDLCYTFTIYDAYGDGICCGWGIGGYEIIDPLGDVIISGGEFGSIQSHNICFDYLCALDAEIDISQESDLEAGDGAIMITAMNGDGPYQYSIDGGETFQDENLFTDLSQGEYDIVVVGTDETCTFETTVELFACTIDIVIETVQETTGDSGDGQIIITANNGNDPVGYSIDGGDTFQSDNVFEGVDAGEYDVVVKDAGDCTIEETVTVNACALDTDIEIVSSPSNEGSITINVNNGEAPYQYSITGIVFQTNNTFTGLPAGDYNVVAIDAEGCQYESTVTLDNCSLEASIEITPSSGSDGAINITSTGGDEPYQYSIDGGETFQDSPNFSGLSADDYDIVVRDASNCQMMDKVSLNVTGINDLVYGYSIDVMPNPTDGLFKINITGLQNDTDVFLPFEVYDTQGKLLQSAKLVKYDGVYTGPVSLENNPAGIYYVRFLDARINRMVRVVKSK